MKSAPVLLGVLLTGLLGVSEAKSCHGVEFPERQEVNGISLMLNGLGMRKATFLKVNVYVAALYVTHPSRDPGPLLDPRSAALLTLRFVRNVGVDDLRKAWGEGFEKTAKQQLPVLYDRIATLSGWMSDMKTGQALTFTRVPGTGIQVNVAGTNRGVILGDDFARAFLAIWLGPEPPNAELKSGLLGGECD